VSVQDATDLATAVRAGNVSATEVARYALDRAGADELGAVWLVTEERALGEIRTMLDQYLENPVDYIPEAAPAAGEDGK